MMTLLNDCQSRFGGLLDPECKSAVDDCKLNSASSYVGSRSKPSAIM